MSKTIEQRIFENSQELWSLTGIEGHPGIPGPLGNAREKWDRNAAYLEGAAFTLEQIVLRLRLKKERGGDK